MKTVACSDCRGTGRITYGIAGHFCDAPTSSADCLACGGSGVDVDATEEANDPGDEANLALLQASVSLAAGGVRRFRSAS